VRTIQKIAKTGVIVQGVKGGEVLTNMRQEADKKKNKRMTPIQEVLPQKLLEEMPVSAEDWGQTPKSVQNLEIELLRHLQGLEVAAWKL
jgi:hypothetical protein